MKIKVFRANVELKEIADREFPDLAPDYPELQSVSMKRIVDRLEAEQLQEEEPMIVISDLAEFCNLCLESRIPVAALLSEEGVNQDFSFMRYALTSVEDPDQDYLYKIWQRHQGLPWTITETDRCVIRETTLADVPLFYRIYADPGITAYMEGLFPKMEEELQYTRDYIDKVYGFYGFGMWTIVLKETGEVMGRAGLSMREEFDTPELGYMVARTYQGKGIALEVCRAILEYGRDELGFEEVQILTEKENTASVRLAEKLGFSWAEQVETVHTVKQESNQKVYQRYKKVSL